jgi:hypothetical protein
MRRLLLVLAIVPGCFADAPPVDDEDDGIAAEDDAADGDDGSSDDGEASSSAGEPADPLDAYGPCEIDSDCPLIPGDKGDIGENPRCVQGTCTIRCAQASFSSGVCPGYYDFQVDTFYPILCNDDGYCTIVRDPYDPGPGTCPEGMVNGETQTVPDLACVWPQ